MRENHLHDEKAGNHYVGRVATGLNINITNFTVSCLYFELAEDGAGDGDHEAVCIGEKIKLAIKLLIVGGAHMNPLIYNIRLHSYASIYYHFEFLNSNIHARSRIWQAPLFQQ